MPTEKKNIDNLVEAIMSRITCSKCDCEDETPADGYGAAEDFYEEGWRCTESNVYCPDCAKKHHIK